MATFQAGQLVRVDFAGFGVYIAVEYVGPLPVAPKSPKGGHRVQIPGVTGIKRIQRDPLPFDGDETAIRTAWARIASR